MGRRAKLWKHSNGQWATSAGGKCTYFGTDKKIAQGLFHEHLERRHSPVVTAIRVDDLCGQFLAALDSEECTRQQKTWALRLWCEWRLGSTPNGTRQAADVTKSDLQRFVRSLKEQYSATSINHIIAGVKMCWRWASQEEPPLLARNPLVGVRKVPTPPREPEYLERFQVAALIREARHDHAFWREVHGVIRRPSENPYRVFANMIRLAYYTGMRLGEVCRLQWSMVDYNAQQIRMRQHKTARSTGKLRVVILTPATARLLRRQPTRQGHVFLNSRRQPFDPRYVSQRFRHLRDKLGIPRIFRLTSLRHLYASDHLRSGHSSKMVADLLGHTSTREVESTYGHLLDEDYRRASRQLEDFRRQLAARSRQNGKAPDLP